MRVNKKWEENIIREKNGMCRKDAKKKRMIQKSQRAKREKVEYDDSDLVGDED